MFEMNDEQRGLFEKLTPLQKEIALNSISGMNDIDAYKNSKGKAKTIKAMEASVSEILSNLKVKSFIASMANTVVNDAVMSRQEMMETLTRLSRVNISDIESATLEELTELKGGYDIKLKAIHSSMKQLSDLAGYNAASKIDHQSSDGSMSPKDMTDEEFEEKLASYGINIEV